ncbi:putative cytochrome P450 9f2 [Pseudolycoriella hygida]|uniref:Cytochrome P450 9f2 n=1 Tax=Pseudolycoriella hygida TaxID=35572 RepID=A0A9Q0RS57_9DIPT|nr:putative cytochrome P450 9f2 [Pseudolycoriella hygida]
MRSTLSPAFTGSKMRQMFDFVVTVSRQTADSLKHQIQQGVSKEVEFKDLAMKFTVDNIASCAFGIEVNSFRDPGNSFHTIAKKFSESGTFKILLKFSGYLLAPSLMKFFKIKFFDESVNKFFQKAILDTIKVREEKGIIRHDMINLLIQAKKGNLTHESGDEKIVDGFATVQELQTGKAGVKRKWNDEDLAAQCFIFFLAGFDTVATAMTFMAYELAINPDVQQNLYEEIVETDNLLNGLSVTYDKLQNMKYMDQVVCEVLRKWPSAPLTDRICIKDYELEYDGKKILIEKGKNFLIPIWAIHNDPNYFPDPSKFDPERFSDENKRSIREYTYLPFGTGPRNCIGSRFALMEIKTIFYYLLLQFKVSVTSKTQIPLQLKKVPVALKTEKGVWVELQPR